MLEKIEGIAMFRFHPEKVLKPSILQIGHLAEPLRDGSRRLNVGMLQGERAVLLDIGVADIQIRHDMRIHAPGLLARSAEDVVAPHLLVDGPVAFAVVARGKGAEAPRRRARAGLRHRPDADGRGLPSRMRCREDPPLPRVAAVEAGPGKGVIRRRRRDGLPARLRGWTLHRNPSSGTRSPSTPLPLRPPVSQSTRPVSEPEPLCPHRLPLPSISGTL